jgi:hypothetical protein
MPSASKAIFASAHSVEIGLSAAIVSVAGDQPQVLVVRHPGMRDALPFGPFEPLRHRTLEGGLRSWVKDQTYLAFDYAEQLCLGRLVRLFPMGRLAQRQTWHHRAKHRPGAQAFRACR